MPNQVRVGVGVTGAKQASSEVDNLRDKFDRLQKQGAKGFAIGAGASLGIGAMNLLGDAVHGVTGLIGDSIHAAMEEEASISKLTTSIRANVAGWDGNTAAIERTLKARMALGFSDEEQRNSLALLVAATHDINKALAVQAVAMDLARFKHISLQDASEALTKIEAGRFRGLASLGIALKAGATTEEALAAVEKVAAGQREEFANTTEGKLLKAQVQVNESMERFGKVILPLVAQGADYVSNVLDGTTVSLENLTSDKSTGAQMALKRLTEEADKNGLSIDALYAEWQAKGGDIAAVAYDMAHKVVRSGDDIRESNKLAGASAAGMANTMSTAADKAADDTQAAFDRIKAQYRALRKSATETATDIVDNYYNVLITQDQLVATEAEISANRRILASSTATAAEKRDAQVALHTLTRDRDKYLQELASAGETHTKLFNKSMKELLKDLRHAHGKEREEILAEIRALQLLSAQAALSSGAVGTLNDRITATLAKGGYVSAAGAGHRAAGGPVSPGQTYTVGEHGPETLVMGSGSGTVVANGGAGGSGGWTGAYPVAVPANWTPGQQQAFAREAAPHIARELQRMGLL